MNKDIVIKDASIYKDNCIGSGKIGDCYLIDNNKIYKEFHSLQNGLYIYEKLCRINNNSYAFPETLVFKDEEKGIYNFIGYIRKFIDGCELSKLNNNIEIGIFKESIKTLINNTKQLNGYSLKINDLNMNNILYTTNNELVVIDTDMFEIGSLFSDTDIELHNLECINNVIGKYMKLSNNYKYDELNKLNLCVTRGYVSINTLIDNIIYMEEEISEERINNVNDFVKKLELVK